MSIFDFIPVAFKFIRRKDDIGNAWAMFQPVLKEWQKVAPVLVPLVKDIFNDFKPELDRPLGEEPVSYDTAWVQQTLNMLYGTKLVVDGKSGPATEALVRRFQEEHGLKVDGDAGAITRAWLYVERQKHERL